jgi:hypothetical protein
MSILQVSNIHFESTGNNRIHYDASSNNLSLVAGGVNVLNVNSSMVEIFGVHTKGYPIRNLVNTGIYTTLSGDAGKLIYTNANVVVNGAVFSVGDSITIFNPPIPYPAGASITVSAGTGATLRLSSSSIGNRTIAGGGFAQIYMVASNTFICTFGSGVS